MKDTIATDEDVLMHRGAKGAWDLPGGGRAIGLDALIQALQAHWLSLSPNLPQIDDVRIIGIALSKRVR